MSGGPNKWTQIQVTNKKPSEMQDLEINLEEDIKEDDQGDQQGGNDQGSNQQTTNRNNNAGVQTSAKNEDSKTGTKVQQSQKTNVTQGSQVNEEDDGEEPQGQSRRARRIRFLSSRVQELEAQLGQERAGRNSVIQEKNQIQANHVTQQAAFYKARVDEKTSEYEKAVESNDPKAQAKALRELNDAQIKAQVYEAAEQEVEDEPQVQQQNQRQAQPQAPQAALRWVEKNKWFMTNEAAHLATRAVNARLMQEGYDPNSDDFYEELDERLSSEGLDLNKLNGVQPQNQQRPQNQGQQSAAVRQQRKSPVGSSEGETQGNSNDSGRTQFKREGNKVLVTPSDDDREMAENLGTPIETYMQSKLIYEEHGGKGYTPIVIRGKR